MVVINNPMAVGRIVLSMRSKPGQEVDFPRQVCLLDAKFKVLKCAWTTANHFEFDGLKMGLYVVRVTSSYGENATDIVDLGQGGVAQTQLVIAAPKKKRPPKLPMLREGRSRGTESNDTSIEMDEFFIDQDLEDRISLISGNEEDPQDLKSVTPKVLRETLDFERGDLSENDHYVIIPDYAMLELWTFQADKWKKKSTKKINIDLLKNQSRTVQYGASNEVCMLVAVSEIFNKKVINCPFNSDFDVLLEWDGSEDSLIHPLTISVSIGNTDADTLLTMMNNGSFRDAKSFADSELAEHLLWGKLDDPVAAAVGGYYLLLTKDLDRLHNWANNLANWFGWLPDGAIIHAWQMISRGVSDDQGVSVRSRLLEAFERGVPLYSEGLRLLFDGLNQLASISKQEDLAVLTTLERLRPYVRCADWTQKLTTLNGMELNRDGRWPVIDLNSKLLKNL